MAEGKKSFILYCEWKELFLKLSDEDAGKLIKHIFKYVNDENPEPENMLIDVAFTSIKQQFKRDLKKYESIVDRNKVNGSKGGRPSKETQNNPNNPVGLLETQNNPRITQANPKKPIKDKGEGIRDNDKGKRINDNEIKRQYDGAKSENTFPAIKKSRFTKDSIPERKKEFQNDILEHANKYPDLDRKDLNNFYGHWTEHGKNDVKMKFEKQKSFSVSHRLSTWSQNKPKFAGNFGNKKNESVDDVFDRILNPNSDNQQNQLT